MPDGHRRPVLRRGREGGLGLARREGQRAGPVLDVRHHGAADGDRRSRGGRGGRGGARPARVTRAADRDRARHPAQRPPGAAARRRPRAGRLPRHRGAGDPRRHGSPARSPAPAGEARVTHAGMAPLLPPLPPQAHVVLPTRVDPPLPLPRLRALGELVEVRAGDLRFTREEAGAYLAGPMGLSLTPADVATLADRTEGWAAALQLAGLSLQDRDDVGEVVARFAGDDRFIVDYLADEVLARLPDDVRSFLLSTSVLDRLTGPLCDAVTAGSGGAARLVALERANLFVVPLDDRRQWYRYHHLFADVLRVHLAEQGPDQAELHRRAGVWFADNGDVPEAVRHALAGNDLARAADLMELAIPAMHRDRREAELVRWVAALPDEVVRVRPVLGVAFAGALAQVSAFDSIGRRLTDVELSLRP